MDKDGVAWHRDYEDPSSSLARRLKVVRNELRAAFTAVRPADGELPGLLADDGIVIWTRGRNDDGPDPSTAIRELFTAHGFTEVGFTAPDDARFRVGAHRLGARSDHAPVQPAPRMFTFIASG